MTLSTRLNAVAADADRFKVGHVVASTSGSVVNVVDDARDCVAPGALARLAEVFITFEDATSTLAPLPAVAARGSAAADVLLPRRTLVAPWMERAGL